MIYQDSHVTLYQGHALSVLRDNKGRFIKGSHYSAKTEFKKGTHWRKEKPFWNKQWLYTEYVVNQRPAIDIAKQFSVTENAILFWIKKLEIPTRQMTEIRKIKYWGCDGESNPMFGVRGEKHPNWQGGNTPLRQRIYSSLEWKEIVKQVHIRDNNLCRLCGSKNALQIHHISPVRQSPLLITDVGNAILLCAKCHKKIKNKENRWRKKLYKLIQEN